MIYEYRAYSVAPGRMGDLQNRFRDHTMALLKKHDIKPVAFFTTVIADNCNQLIWICEFRDLAHREAAWAAFGADPVWQKALKESHVNGELVMNIENKILAPTDFSPMK